MKIFTLRRIVFILAFILFIIVVRHIYVSFFVKVKTECAKLTQFDEFVDAKALIVRNEKALSSENSFLRITCGHNSKVAGGQCLARVYSSEDELQSDNNSNSSFNFANEDINSEINRLIKKLSHQQKYDKKLDYLVNIHEKILQNDKNLKLSNSFSENKSSNSGFEKLKSDCSGFFSSCSDGFENLGLDISDDEIKNLNIRDYEKLNDSDPNIFGKLVEGSKCNIICFLDKNVDLDKKKFSIKFQLNSNLVECDLVKILDSNNGGKIAVFEAEINEFLINSRIENVKIRTRSATGVKIERDNIHDYKGQRGVFTLERKILKFKPVKINYENDEFAICDLDGSEGGLKINDLIVIGGDRLYDEKIIMI